MKTVFKPAIAGLSRLSYPQKFVLISLLFVLPLALAMYLLLSQIDSSTATAQNEQQGLRYLQPLRDLMLHVPQEKLVTHLFLAGDKNSKKDIAPVQAQIDADMAQLGSVDKEYGKGWGTTATFTNLQTQWQTLSSALLTRSVTESDALHTTFIASVRSFITQVGNASALILDPKLDSYYAIDAVLLKLPEAQDLVAQMTFTGQTIFQRLAATPEPVAPVDPSTSGQCTNTAGCNQRMTYVDGILTSDERSQLLFQLGLIQNNRAEIEAGLNTAMSNNDLHNLKPLLDALLQEFSGVTRSFQQVVAIDLLALRSTTQRDEFNGSASRTLNANFALWDKVAAGLNTILQARIDNLNQQTFAIAAFAAIILVFVIYLLISFYLSVMAMVSRLTLVSQRMVDGDLSQRVEITNHDELGQVVTSFNNVATTLMATSIALQTRQTASAEISHNMLVQAAELHATANQQKSGSLEQVAVVTEVNAAVEELAVTARNIADITRQVNDAVSLAVMDSTEIENTTDLTARQSEKGLLAVERTVEVSLEGAAFYEQLLTTMQDLQTKNADMRRILHLLADISGQTHLLSLNAAIEAAGAGTYGARFGIVAQEVKTLADRSSAASHEVVQIVQEIENVTYNTVRLADNGYAKARNITAVAGEAGEVIQEMTRISAQAQVQASAIRRAAETVQQRTEMIEVATNQQRIASEQVLEAINRLGMVAEQNVAGSNTIFATATGLETVAQRLSATLNA